MWRRAKRSSDSGRHSARNRQVGISRSAWPEMSRSLGQSLVQLQKTAVSTMIVGVEERVSLSTKVPTLARIEIQILRPGN